VGVNFILQSSFGGWVRHKPTY